MVITVSYRSSNIPNVIFFKGCRNRFAKGKLHFYRFPREAERRNAWIQFTRKGSSFQPKGSSTICQVHFLSECFVEKKDRLHLSKDAVPQLYFKQTSLGMEMVTVPYDSEKRTYFGPESIDILRGTLSVEDMDAICKKRQERAVELKGMCRFCFSETKNQSKCVSTSMLDTYQINLEDFNLRILPDDLCGSLVCEQCFHQIVEIDLFKKKCREAQEDVLAEIVELDAKIQEVQEAINNGKTWYKAEMGTAAMETIDASAVEIIEEHLVDEEEFDNQQYEPQINSHEEYIEEIPEGYEIVYQQLPNIDATEAKLPEFIAEDPGDMQTLMYPKQEEVMLCGVDEYAVESTDDIIKNPERNRFCFRIYECFFCKMVSFPQH